MLIKFTLNSIALIFVEKNKKKLHSQHALPGSCEHVYYRISMDLDGLNAHFGLLCIASLVIPVYGLPISIMNTVTVATAATNPVPCTFGQTLHQFDAKTLSTNMSLIKSNDGCVRARWSILKIENKPKNIHREITVG